MAKKTTSKKHTQLAVTTDKSTITPEAMEKVLLQGGLEKLTPQERLHYYNSLCVSLGLNPLTRPFEYMTLDGKLTLYARKDCTEQLRKRDKISISIKSREFTNGLYVVTAVATNGEGRSDESIGAVAVQGIEGKNLANQLMRAETKAKRRATLSIAGLGMFDESEEASDPEPQSTEPKTPDEMKAAVAKVDAEIIEKEKERFVEKGLDPELAEDMQPSKVHPAVLLEAQAQVEVITNGSEDAYKNVESHIGKGGGIVLGKKVGEMVHPKLWVWCKDYIEKINPKVRSAADNTLLSAVTVALNNMNKPKQPEVIEVNPEVVQVTDWKSETVTIEVSGIKGKKLGELDDVILTKLKEQVLDKPEISSKVGVTPRFRALFQMALDSRGLFKADSELRYMIDAKNTDLILVEEDFVKLLATKDFAILTNNEKCLNDIAGPLLLYIWQNIEDIHQAIKESQSPQKPTSKTKKKKTEEDKPPF